MSAAKLPEAINEAKERLQKQICELRLPSELADDLIGHHTLVNYNKGAMVVLQGSPADVVFCLLLLWSMGASVPGSPAVLGSVS